MGTLSRLAALLLPCLVLLAVLPGRTGAGSRPPVCDLLDSPQAAYISGGGLTLLQNECRDAPRVQPAAVERPSSTVAATALSGTDLRLNDPSSDQPPSTTQSETAIQACGETRIAAWNDSGSVAQGSFTGYARSGDGGVTWTDRGHFPGLTGSDPALASDAGCRFYFAAGTFAGGCSRIGVVRSDDGGLTWSAPANASPDVSCDNFQDKETIEADATTGLHAGNVYACWDDRGSSEIRVLFSRSTDGGRTFSGPLTVSSFPFGYATGCQVAVGPGGEVTIAWTDGLTLGLYSRVSTDGGQSFGPARSIAASQIIGAFRDCGGSYRPLLNGDIRAFNWPALAVNPQNGHLHVAWNDNRSGNPDVYYSRSTDMGAHWSAPVRLNHDSGTTDQFQPALGFTGSGVLRAIWYDRRLDPAANYLIDVFSTVSIDDGVKFAPDQRITDVSFGVPPTNPNFDPNVVACYMGDYIGITGGQEAHYLAWGDNRNIVAGHPDPDVYFDTRSAAGRALLVTRTDDPEPDACLPDDCSLREAVLAANESPGADTIDLPAGAYVIQRVGTGEDAGLRGDIDIDSDVTMRGSGAGLTSVDGRAIERVFEVRPDVSAKISGLTVTGGATYGVPGGPVADGGGILNRGDLTLDAVLITENRADRAAYGGGIHNAATLTLRNSTIQGNTAAFDGGGIYNASVIEVSNSTITGNEVQLGRGGGLVSASTASLNNVTIYQNTASAPASVPIANLVNGSTGTLTIANSIVAGAGDSANCGGVIQSLGHNLEDASTCDFDAEGDLAGVDAHLLPLGDNGGHTPTHALGDGSPAIDAGGPLICETSDQRGYPRPADGNGDTIAVCDIGAVEAGARPLGDVDCDFDVDSLDALWVLRHVAGIQPDAACLAAAGDVNCDATVDSLDALTILRFVAGLPSQRPPGCPALGPG